jgi:hypothetical protein
VFRRFHARNHPYFQGVLQRMETHPGILSPLRGFDFHSFGTVG